MNLPEYSNKPGRKTEILNRSPLLRKFYAADLTQDSWANILEDDIQSTFQEIEKSIEDWDYLQTFSGVVEMIKSQGVFGKDRYPTEISPLIETLTLIGFQINSEEDGELIADDVLSMLSYAGIIGQNVNDEIARATIVGLFNFGVLIRERCNYNPEAFIDFVNGLNMEDLGDPGFEGDSPADD